VKPYYKDKWTTIYHGDCRDVLPQLDKVDLVLTDPPYGLARFKNGIGEHSRLQIKSISTAFNNNTPDRATLLALLCKGKEACIWGMNNFKLPVTEHFLVWDKAQTVDNFASAELAWCNFRQPAKVFHYSTVKHNQTKLKVHPTEKPEELMRWCIMLADSPQTILDPFMGSGTTLRAAKDLQRKAIGIEIEERYCEIAAKRLAQGTPRKEIKTKVDLKNVQPGFGLMRNLSQ